MVEGKLSSHATAIAWLDALVRRADEGDKDALRQVREVFDAVPGMWDAYASLAETAESALIHALAGDRVMTRESLRKKLAAMRIELAGQDPSSLERLAAERIVVSWLLSYEADLTYVRSLQMSSPRESEYHQRRQDRAARQHLRALKSMAVIRRLLAPHQVQVNVGERQVNIAGEQVNVAGAMRSRPHHRKRLRTPDSAG